MNKKIATTRFRLNRLSGSAKRATPAHAQDSVSRSVKSTLIATKKISFPARWLALVAPRPRPRLSMRWLLLLMAFAVILPAMAFAAPGQTWQQKHPGGHVAPVLTITNDHDHTVTHLLLGVEGRGAHGEIKALIMNVVGQKGVPEGTMLQYIFPRAMVEGNTGAVLDKEGSHDVVVVKGSLSGKTSASLNISYLRNALTGSRRSCPLRLEKTSNGTWGLIVPSTGKVVRSAFVDSWALGVKSIEPLCAAK